MTNLRSANKRQYLQYFSALENIEEINKKIPDLVTKLESIDAWREEGDSYQFDLDQKNEILDKIKELDDARDKLEMWIMLLKSIMRVLN